jgi:predicted ATP-dependent endonuclease of OLD family
VTHNAYVLNKLGLEKVILLHGQSSATLSALPKETYEYFKKLSGYDTLRLILAKKAILVEGPSDELIVQKAYHTKNGKLPLEAGVDVINVRGLSFARFLDIAKLLKKEVAVVTDNDGDFQKKVVEKYAAYTASHIRICSGKDDTLNTLEPNLVAVNDLATLNKILGRDFTDKPTLATYMEANKTDSALAIFETKEPIKFPDYIENAIA